jgi:hypothetical protein
MVLLIHPARASAQGDVVSRKAQSKALAERIDKIIHARLLDEKMQPGPRAELPQLVRRLHIDLAGKIPSVVQLVDLIDPTNDSPTKLEDRIDELLASPDYASNFAHHWRSIVLRGANQQGGQSIQFEDWMRDRLMNNTSYDSIAKDLMNAPQGQQGPAAFYAVNGSKAESMAGATARVFMGVKIECAECHKHPFADWTRKQFWELAAFFSNAPGDAGKKIRIPQSDQIVQAKFLTGEEPIFVKTPKSTLADWVATSKNPYFAKAGVDHIWQYFFGVSLAEPILEPNEASTPAHPVLLDELAKAFIDSDFDLKMLIRAIVLTDAYQRGSVALSETSKNDTYMFAKMPMRGMTPEQLFDSFCVATNYREPVAANPPARGLQRPRTQNAVRDQFLTLFRSQDRATETQTSILQALFLMNGQFVTERSRHVMQTIAVQDTTTQRRVEALYMLVLSRLPRQTEMDRMVHHIESSADPRQAVADVCWVLLNGSEFMMNH